MRAPKVGDARGVREIAKMMLDNVFAVVDEQIDLAEARIRRGERTALVFASMRAAVARMRNATY